ncbi:MAG: tRNA (adenosine(37)-N6)-threonylcarbamoyltransferase complex ATPase subunit type 1 TsaE [Candidatus Binatia bacterium]
MTYETRSSSTEETQAWGRRLAHELSAGAIIGLDGDLGTGKTCFVKGLATGLGIAEEEISSPTFTLIAEHYTGRLPLYHIDLYRLEGGEVSELGIEEYLFGQGICVIEWFQFLPPTIVSEYVHVSFAFAAEEARVLTWSIRGKRYENVIQMLLTGRALKDKV